MTNPLADFYRQKEIYITLPTGGRWLTEKPHLSTDGELGVRPLTLNDEMMLSIPDSLYNGESLFELIKSIAPDIKNPYELSMPDFDIILLASRAATYEKKMTVESRCPHCEEANLYELDIPSILSKVKVVGEETEFIMNELKFVLKANTVGALNTYHIRNMEQANLIGQLEKIDPADRSTHTKEYSKALETVSAASIALIADAIVSITTPDEQIVTDPQHIVDFLLNVNRSVIQRIEDNLRKLNENGLDKEFTFMCSSESCNKEFTGPVEFNPAFFFKNLSSILKEKSLK